jgi:hypothetical protein|tara:strand:- start:2846 stop:3049 length:204 start_codon:yes stop_codon:yes gene_type:complete
MSHKLLEFRESLTSSDYGLIVGDQGELKGIWIPEGKQEDCIPDNIVSLCVAKFGIDPNGNGHSAVLQ